MGLPPSPPPLPPPPPPPPRALSAQSHRPGALIYTQPRAAPTPPGSEASPAGHRPNWALGGFKFLRRQKPTKRVLRHRNSVVAPFSPAAAVKTTSAVVAAAAATAQTAPKQKDQHVSLSRRFFRYPLKALRSLRGDRLEEAGKQRDSKRVSRTLQLIPPSKPSRFSTGAYGRVRRARFLSRVMRSRRGRKKAANSNTQTGPARGHKSHKDPLLFKRNTTVTRRQARSISKGKQREIPPASKAKDVMAPPRPLVDSTRSCPDCHYSARLCLCDVTLSGVDKFGTVAYSGPSTYHFGSTTSLSSAADLSALPPLNLADDRHLPRVEPTEGAGSLAPVRSLTLVGDATNSDDAWTDVTFANTTSEATVRSVSASHTSLPGVTAPPRLLPTPSQHESHNVHGAPSVGALVQLDDPFQEPRHALDEAPQTTTQYTLPPQKADERHAEVTSPSPRRPHQAEAMLLPPRPAYMCAQSPTKGSTSSPSSSRSEFSARVSEGHVPKRSSLAPAAALPTAVSHSTIPSLWSRSSFDPDASNRALYLNSPSTTLRSRIDEDDVAADWSVCDTTASDQTVLRPMKPGNERPTEITPLVAESGFASDPSSDEDDNSARGLVVSAGNQGDIGLGLQLPSPASLPTQLRDRRRSDGLEQRRSGMSLSRPVSTTTTTSSLSGLSRTATLDKLLSDLAKWKARRPAFPMPTSTPSDRQVGSQAAGGLVTPKSAPIVEAKRRVAGLGLVLPSSESQGSMLSSRTIPSGAEVTSSALLHRLRNASADTAASDWISSSGAQERGEEQVAETSPDRLCDIAEDAKEAGDRPEHEAADATHALPERAPVNPFEDFDGRSGGHTYIDVSPLLCSSSSFESGNSRDVSPERSEASPSSSSQPTSVPEEEPATSLTLPGPTADRIFVSGKSRDGDSSHGDRAEGEISLASARAVNESCDSDLSGLQDAPVRPLLNLRSQESVEAFSTPPGLMVASASVDPFNQFVQNQFDQFERYALATAAFDTSYPLDQGGAEDSSFDPDVYSEYHTNDGYYEARGNSQTAGCSLSAGGEDPFRYSEDPFNDSTIEASAEHVIPPELQRSPRDVPISPRSPPEVPRRRPLTPRKRRQRRQLSLIWRDGELEPSGPGETSYQSPTADLLDDYLSGE